MRHSILIAAILLMAGAATAADGWSNEPDGTRNCSVLNTGSCYYDFSGTTDSKTLAISSTCLPVTVSLNPDENGTNTGAEVQLYDCSEPTGSTNHCQVIAYSINGVLSTATLDGSSTGRVAVDGITTNLLWVDVTANPSSDDARVKVTCRGGQ